MAIGTGLLNWVVATRMKGVAACETENGLQQTLRHSVFGYRLKGIAGTTGIETTGRCLKR